MKALFRSSWLGSAAAAVVSATALAAPATQPSAGLDPELLSPTKLTSARGDVDAEGGYAAPAFGDVDGDGVKDLLVGQFKDGSCKVYKNVGTNEKPNFAKWVWLKAQGDYAHVGYG
ncbi:MAG TPA: hypothetical protein VF669_09590 [Tepidisphaeraceae bacterium]|jgi:opacity protein-like surface antigen